MPPQLRKGVRSPGTELTKRQSKRTKKNTAADGQQQLALPIVEPPVCVATLNDLDPRKTQSNAAVFTEEGEVGMVGLVSSAIKV
jgi:hypothetical protein